MGKTPKSKNVDNRGKSQLQKKVLLHRPMNSGNGRMLFPVISEQSAAPKRRMKLSGTLSRKSSLGKGIIKVYSSSITEHSSEESRIAIMSIVAAESAESLNTNHQPDIILENGKDDSQGKEEAKCFKDKPITNGSEAGAIILPKTEAGDVNDNSSKQVKELNAIQEPVGDSGSSVKLLKDEEVDPKKQRSGTPQSRSSTPQRKSGRVRSKHDSPNKSTTSSTLTPGLKILKINLMPCKNITNGTTEARSKVDNTSAKVKNLKTTDEESQKLVDANLTKENDDGDVEATIVQSETVTSEVESSNPQATDVNAPYLRSLRLVSGRRSLSSNSPVKSLPVSSTSGSNTASISQWRKRQSRKKESTLVKDESECQGTENDLNSSVSSGKRKAERADDQSIEYPVSNVKKSKNEDDEIKLFLSDESEDNNHQENESEEYFNSSQYSKSSDDIMAELKDLNESSDDHFVKNESMEYAYEAREIESSEKLHEASTGANQSSNKRWCILM